MVSRANDVTNRNATGDFKAHVHHQSYLTPVRNGGDVLIADFKARFGKRPERPAEHFGFASSN
jgi:hypothetical protein